MASDNGFAHQPVYTILLCVRTSSRLGVTRACQERWYRVNHICAPYSQTYTTVYIRKVRCAAAWKSSINRTFIFALYAPKKSWRRLTSPTLLLDGYLDIFHFLQQAPSYCKFEWAEASCMLFCAGIVLFAPRPQIKGQRSRLAGGAGPLLPLAGARGRSDSSGVWLSASPLGRLQQPGSAAHAKVQPLCWRAPKALAAPVLIGDSYRHFYTRKVLHVTVQQISMKLRLANASHVWRASGRFMNTD